MPRPAVRANAIGLTRREQQVLVLLCEGLRTAEIAARLHRSVRTIDHHVEAVLAKLGVDSRLAAAQAAARAGLPSRGQSGQAPAEKLAGLPLWLRAAAAMLGSRTMARCRCRPRRSSMPRDLIERQFPDGL